MTDPTFVAVDHPTDGVTRLTLRRSEKRNALSTAVRDQMSDALDAAAVDEDCRCVVITGSDGCFSAGFDLREFEVDGEEFQARLWASSERWHLRLLDFPLPLVAAVDGPALAGGFDLTTMCDLRVASDRARFAHPEYTWGPVVTGPLEVLVGAAVTRELCFTGRELDAAEALALRLVSRVVAPDELEAASLEMAGRVAAAQRSALVENKARMLRRAALITPQGGLAI